MERLLVRDRRRYVLYPIEHEDLWAFYKKAEASFWTAEELDLSCDREDWARLSEEERQFVCVVLAFFAGADGIVGENLAQNFLRDVELPEARFFYAFQLMMENVHSEVYSLLLDSYVSDPDEKRRLFNAVEECPAVRLKAEWAMRWIQGGSFVERLVAFAAVEGVFFSASFCAIYWLKQRGLMLGLSHSNELIARDEALHCDFACYLYRHYVDRTLSPARVSEIVASAVEVELEFVGSALPVDLLGMNATLMSRYVKFIADRLLAALGCPAMFLVENPFDFMELVSLEGKTNFFERRVGDYQRARVLSEQEERYFSLDADF